MFPDFAITPIVPVFNQNIVVFAPSFGSTVSNPFTLVGDARLFEGAGNWELVDAANQVLASGSFTAAEAGPSYGRFVVSVSYSVPTGQVGALRVFSLSPADGSRINELGYPIFLTP